MQIGLRMESYVAMSCSLEWVGVKNARDRGNLASESRARRFRSGVAGSTRQTPTALKGGGNGHTHSILVCTMVHWYT